MSLAVVTPSNTKASSRVDISAVQDFLQCETPDSWVEAALANQTIMLIDHANCEKKAASTAMTML
ncbi:MAG: tRNA isopentenyl-2-thiomethyl-A-37 hydroxylase MiaE, partial [Pseudomonadales bacterium]